MPGWDPATPGVLRLPSGRLVRGRGLHYPLPAGPGPTFALYLLGRRPPAVSWESRWVRWPDFRRPADRADAVAALHEAWERAAADRVEIACQGGVGRTGTALACLAVLDGLPSDHAVRYVREHYAPGAVEPLASAASPRVSAERSRRREPDHGGPRCAGDSHLAESTEPGRLYTFTVASRDGQRPPSNIGR